MKRLPHETSLLLAAWRRCEEEGKQRQFWRMLKVATALRRLQDNERKEEQAQ